MKRKHRYSVITMLTLFLWQAFSFAQTPSSLNDGLVAYYPFDGTANDESGNGNHGIVNGATLTTDRFGNADSAYEFDGIDDYIEIQNSDSMNPKHITVSAWYFATKSFVGDGNNVIIHKPYTGHVSPYYQWHLGVRGNQYRADKSSVFHPCVANNDIILENHSRIINTEDFLGNWYHVVMSFDGTTLKAYFNGELDGVSTATSDFISSYDTNIFIGKHGNLNRQGIDYTPGIIDDILVYNRALSETEIKALYHLEGKLELPKPVISGCDAVTEGLVACYPFDGNADDDSGNGNDGTVNGAMLTTDRFGNADSAEHFNGSSSSIKVNHSQSLDIRSNITMTAWINTTGTASHSGIIHKFLPGTGVTGFGMWQNHYNDPKASCYFAYNWPYKYGRVISETDVEDGKWHHLVCTYNGQTIKIYVDGIEDNSVPYSGGLRFNNTPLYIGVDSRHNNRYFNGDIDGVRIYNRALSEAEIQTLYNLGQTDENRLTVNKTGNGRGTLRAKLKGEDWNLVCQSDCSEASEIYPLDSQVILTASPEKGFIFSGWRGDCTGTETRLTFTMNSATTCTAQFEPDASNSALLTVNTDGPGQGTVTSADGYLNCGLDCSAFYRLDKRVTLEATPNPDNLFIGWSGDCAGPKTKVGVTMNAAKNCTATFKPKPIGALTLSVDKIGEGQAVISGRFNGERTLYCNSSCQQTSDDYQAGDQVILNARALEGFIFKEWTGDCSGTEPKITVLMDQAKHCTAQIDRDPNLVWYELTVNNVGTGQGSVTTSGLNCTETSCTVYYQPDETVRLVPTPALFSEFVGWRGDCEGTTNAKLTMTGDLTCSAEFKSGFEILVEQTLTGFYAQATLENGELAATHYPQTADNQARLKEAFWLSIPTLMQTDQHLGLSNSQTWPQQMNNIEWLPFDANTEYTASIQIQAQDFIGIKVELLNSMGQTETVPIIIYYSDDIPVIDEGDWYSASGVYFSRYAIPIWW